jgi:flagellar biosynthetic protein FlhB
MADDSDRVIPATPRRREAARRQGAMPTAALPAWVATAGTATLLLPVWGTATMPAAADLMRTAIGGAGRPQSLDLWPGLIAVALPTTAVVVVAAAAGLTVRFVLDGFSWQPARITPSLRRIDPFAGLLRIFSWRTVTAALGGGLGLAVMVVAAVLAMRPLLGPAGLSAIGDEPRVAAATWRAAAWLFVAAAVVAVVRWLAARRRFEQQIRMTPEEFAEEAKSAQADPKVRMLQQQRQRQRQPTAGAA